ncbi:caspase family protein [Rhizobium sp. L1K21]|uniref:caspase family protein n=1 Tax=Rhizobium sp. L1K21 TaxID=2954933 RepID=UPI002092A2BA|nr:caspase family protein [Rhizobium sp. L1K21]MCO6186633.1 caspase family protein [Rhizobium sp. L1K21]
MRRLSRSVLLTLACLLMLALMNGAASAQTGRRVALLIGNQTYENVSNLSNPRNDAELMAGVLKEAGFSSVEIASDLDLRGMQKALRDFEDLADGAEVALVYYSGHGMEMNGRNYLIPVDATLKSDRDVADETLVLSRLERALNGATRLKLVILDACRDNPFANTMTRSVASRSLGKGLAKVEPKAPDMLVAFASRAGTVALDGSSGNSPFALALSKFLVEPGLDIRIALGKVRDYVIELTNRQQEPFVYGSLGGAQVILNINEATINMGSGAGENSAAADWENIRDLADKELIEVFLERHGADPVYRLLAEKKLEMLNAQDQSTAGKADDIAWEAIRGSSDAAAFVRFLERYPDSAHRRAAESQIIALVPRASANEESISPARRDCYLLAAEPGAIPGYPGVALKRIDAGRALTACAQAVNEEPDNGMLIDFLARAHEASNNAKEASEAYEKAAAAGNTYAMTNLGWLHLDANGVDADGNRARTLFEQAAKAGNPFAQTSLAWAYRNGKAGLDKDMKQALNWYRQAAEQAYGKAMAALGFLYREGDGVDQNYVTSLNWYRKAAEAGDVDAMTATAYAHEQGLGTAKNMESARQWYEKAARAGDAYAMAVLGYLYDAGSGGKQDYTEARYWYEKAAADGSSYAMSRLARIYDKGLGIAPNPKEAARWALSAIEHGEKAQLQALTDEPQEFTHQFATEVQRLLAEKGAFNGKMDGALGPETLKALEERLP